MKRQRKIEGSFQTCLNSIQDGAESLDDVLARFPAYEADLKPKLEAALWVRERRGAFEARHGFLGTSRRRLLARVGEQDGEPRALAWWRVWWSWYLGRGAGFRLAFQLALLLLLLGSLVWNGGSLRRAAHTWLPGDPTYPLKVLAERLELLVTRGTAGEARLHIEFARRRLLEVQALTFECRYESIPPTVADFAYHVEGAVGAVELVSRQDRAQAGALAAELRGALSEQAGLVLLLEGFAPEGTRTEFSRLRLISEDSASALEDALSPGSSGAQDQATLAHRIRWARRGRAPRT